MKICSAIQILIKYFVLKFWYVDLRIVVIIPTPVV